jgi:hypothetical protein
MCGFTLQSWARSPDPFMPNLKLAMRLSSFVSLTGLLVTGPTVGLAVGLTVALATVASAENRPLNPYPKAVVDQYVEDCSARRGGQAAATCRCIINGIQATYTYQEFQVINRQISQTGQAPPRLAEIIKTCRVRPTSFQRSSRQR